VGAKSTMTPTPESRLLELYDRVAEAPGAIDRLRKFVLDLAVRGKLVEQNPEDEPAEALLERIASAKAARAKEGLIKKPKSSSPINDNEIPIEIPPHWTWLRLNDIGTLAGGMTPSKNQPDYWDGDIIWLSPKDIKVDEATDSELKITSKGLSETRLQRYPPGSLFMVARSGILKRTFPVAINRLPAACNQDIKVLVPYLEGQERYLQIMFRGLTDFILSDLVKTGTTVQSLKYAEFATKPFPLPPLPEQHRIVAKVDELMTLLDRLETTRTQRETTRDRLTTASLARLTAPETTENEFRAHAGFALDALRALTARSNQIKSLRQTILNLAVRGKLVDQDPADEPALAMLSAWVDKKVSQLPKARRSKLLDSWSAAKSSTPHDLPESWAWATAEELCKKVVDCPHSTPKFTSSGIACLDTNSVKSTGLLAEKIRYVSEETFIKRNKRLTPRQGDVVFAREGSVGETVIVPAGLKCCLGQRVMLFRPGPAVSPEWFRLAISEHSSLVRLMGLHKGIGAKHVNVKDMRLSLQPLPPLHEQHRIVAKVGALMTLCNRLEAALSTANTNRARLLKSLLYDALNVSVSDKEAA